MTPNSGITRLISLLLLLLAFDSLTLAAITLEQLLSTFNVEMREDTGGTCNRDYDLEFPTPMLEKVFAAFEDAWLLAAFGLETPNERIRGIVQDPQAFIQFQGLLYLWFGISLTNEGAFASLEDSSAYAMVTGTRTFHLFEQVSVYAYSSRNCADEFAGVNATRTHPENVFGYGLPKFRCLEDYAQFYEHLADADGDEYPFGRNPAEVFGARFVSGPNRGQFLPGLMFDRVQRAYYRPGWPDVERGVCNGEYDAFSVGRGTATHIYGITVCENFFELKSFQDLPIFEGPSYPSDLTQIGAVAESAGAVLLTELFLMTSHREMTLKPRVLPPNNDYFNTDLTQWVVDTEAPAVSFIDAGLLGLVSPESARLNAPNYVMFAFCLAFADLDCLAPFRLVRLDSPTSGLSTATSALSSTVTAMIASMATSGQTSAPHPSS